MTKILVFAKNLAEFRYFSGFERKMAIPEIEINIKLNDISLESKERVESSVLFNFLSLLKKEKSKSDTKAPPMPSTTASTCTTVAWVFIV